MSLLREAIKSIKAALLLGRRFERTVDEVVLLSHRVDRVEQAINQKIMRAAASIEAMATEVRRLAPIVGQMHAAQAAVNGLTESTSAGVQRLESSLAAQQREMIDAHDRLIKAAAELRGFLLGDDAAAGNGSGDGAAPGGFGRRIDAMADQLQRVHDDSAWVRSQVEEKFGRIDAFTIEEYEGLLRFLRKCEYLRAWEPRRGELPRLRTDHPIAIHSDDTRFPRGAKNDNSISPRFNQRLYEFTGRKSPLRVLDLGCAGGGLVRSLLDDGHFAIGLEGSDYPRRVQRAEWSTIPLHLHTCDITRPFTLEDPATGRPFQFDVVTAWEFMEHIRAEDLPQVTDNIRRHLVDGGHLLCSIATFGDFDREKGAVYHQCVQPREWWIDRFVDAGFNPVPDHPFGPEDWLRGSGHARGDWTESQGLGFHLVVRKRATGEARRVTERRLPKFIPNSVPKSGTNLLQTMLNAIPGLTMRPEMVPPESWQTGHSYSAMASSNGDPWIPVDIDCPHFMRQSELESIVSAIRPGEYLRASHIAYSNAMARLMEQYDIKMLLMIRDPRDVVVSQVHYTMRASDNPLHAYYTTTLKTNEERLVASITGSSHLLIGRDTQHISIAQRFNAIRGWMSKPFTHVVRFRDLVGERGGGCARRQHDTILGVLRHLGLEATNDILSAVAEKTFSENSPTFRKGVIGAWQEEFTPKVKTIFKEIAGQTLIDFGYETNFDW